ncbi:MAG: orotidine 5'-phosphate decarboxylase / HUMPS family protein [Nanoarchaeota archaeon]
MRTFAEKWFEAVKRNDSVLCLGLDPAEFEMGRGDKGLPQGTNKLAWSLDYIDAGAPDCAAVKFNKKYLDGPADNYALNTISIRAHTRGLAVIEDNKLADIADSNDAGVYNAAHHRDVDAVTFAQYAGNLKQCADQAHAHDIGAIAMCIMSNPEFEQEKLKAVPLRSREEAQTYRPEDVFHVVYKTSPAAWIPAGEPWPNVFQYIHVAQNARECGIDALVIGAPSGKDSPKPNHIKDEEIAAVRHYAGPDMLILLPGVGAQGGEASAIWRHFAHDHVIVPISRDLMFPKKGTIAEAANRYKCMLNTLRYNQLRN